MLTDGAIWKIGIRFWHWSKGFVGVLRIPAILLFSLGKFRNKKKYSLWETPLQEWHAGAEVCKSVDPTGYFLATEYLREGTGEVVAVVIHEMIPIPTELIAQLLNNSPNFLLSEIRTANLDALAEAKLITQFIVIPWLNLKDSSEGKRMTTIGKFSSKDLNPGMKDSQAE